MRKQTDKEPLPRRQILKQPTKEQEEEQEKLRFEKPLEPENRTRIQTKEPLNLSEHKLIILGEHWGTNGGHGRFSTKKGIDSKVIDVIKFVDGELKEEAA